MIVAPDRTRLAEVLRRMMDELCAPGLTLARADVLRPRVYRLLDVIREANDPADRPVVLAGRLETGQGRRT